MTKDNIHDLIIWKTNLKYILSRYRTKLDVMNKIIRYAEERPEVVCMFESYREKRPDIIKTIDHVEKSIEAINIILEEYSERKSITINKTYAKQKIGFDPDVERNKFVQLQTEKALLVN